MMLKKFVKMSFAEGGRGNGNGNGNQLGLNACVLAPTPGKSWYPGDGGKLARWLRDEGGYF